VACQEISRRFEQNDLKVVADMERLLIELANGQESLIPDTIQSVYSRDVDANHLVL